MPRGSFPKPASPPRWPLTGLSAPNATAIKRRVVSVKVENSPSARPQTGLNSADVVYESLAEGGITRFHAIFHSQNLKVIGPVRSAPNLGHLHRAAVQLAALLLARFGLCDPRTRGGTRADAQRTRRRHPPLHARRIQERAAQPLPEGARSRAPRGYVADTRPRRPFGHSRSIDAPSKATVVVTSIDIPFSVANRSTWTYDRIHKVYLRQNNRVRHFDAATGQQVRARNVVVMWAKMRSTGVPDKLGNPTDHIALDGTGRASVFHDGQQFNGTWTAAKNSPPALAPTTARSSGWRSATRGSRSFRRTPTSR